MYYIDKAELKLPIGNNKLSYEARKEAGSPCILTIPSLMQGSISDVIPGTDIVFEEMDEGQLVSCTGLEHLIQLADAKIPTYIMDNHNHALYFWYREHLKQSFSGGATLIHIDQHADMGKPDTAITQSQCDDLAYIKSYANEICNVGDFIQPALDSGLLKDVIQIRSVTKLLETEMPVGEYILDIDIDFWSAHAPSAAEIAALQHLYEHAAMCTIALSPYFMPLDKSIEILRYIFK